MGFQASNRERLSELLSSDGAANPDYKGSSASNSALSLDRDNQAPVSREQDAGVDCLAINSIDLLQKSQIRGTSRLELGSIYDLRTSKEPEVRRL
ncbi:hypothetical protein H6F61_26430 [Cyanobacteria bacterium FACHB-472]|nr:hypothetical protein [Cyanobacteria bacterium FACHB-472]